MVFILSIMFIAIGLVLWSLFESGKISNDAINIAVAIIGLLFLIAGVFLIINCGIHFYIKLNIESARMAVIDTRTAYVSLLDKYTLLAEQDLTASDSYLKLYEKIIDFNTKVRMAEKYKDMAFWAEGLLYDPRYIGISVIPIS